MKNSLKLLATLLFMTCATLAFADSKALIPLEQEEIININDIDNETLIGFVEGQFPTVVLKINHNERIRLDKFVDEDMKDLAQMHLAEESNINLFFKTNKDLYLRNIDGEFAYRTRSSDWKGLDEYIPGIKRVVLKIHGPEGLHIEIGGIVKKIS
ncbi:MAG: hypothetical protein S4CHLAM123_09530 [Chlamydiales bacterium]|nr:hypothetical protein [Chlamydiales bacterium]